MITASEAQAYLGGLAPPYPLDAVRPTPSRVLEIGAGAGTGTLQLAEAFPQARITSLELDDAARTTLAWRVAATDGLKSRVSILPLSIFEADFLGTFDLVVAKGLVARTDPEGRGGVLMRLSRRMGDDGSALIDDDFGPTDNRSEARHVVAQERIGEFTCAHWRSTEPAENHERTVLDEYVISDRRGDVVHESRIERTEWVADSELIMATIAATGMASSMIAEGWMRLTTP